MTKPNIADHGGIEDELSNEQLERKEKMVSACCLLVHKRKTRHPPLKLTRKFSATIGGISPSPSPCKLPRGHLRSFENWVWIGLPRRSWVATEIPGIALVVSQLKLASIARYPRITGSVGRIWICQRKIVSAKGRWPPCRPSNLLHLGEPLQSNLCWIVTN